MIQLYQTLDLRPIGIPQTLRLSQYDSDFEIIFELTNFDGAWILDTDTTAEIQGTKTDGHGYSADAVFDDQLKTVTIAGDVQMTAAAGRNVYEVVLFHDGDRLGSKNFILDVERAALDAETTASDSKIKNFTEMTEAATQAAETATAAADRAEDAAELFSTDPTLSIAGKAADALATGEAIDSLIPGVTDQARVALLACFRHVAWVDDQGPSLYRTLQDALYPTVLESITATFTQGQAVIMDTDSLDSLRQYLTVTANYSDGTIETVTNYELRGILQPGTSMITAAYEGKTDTFDVTVSHDAVLIGISAVFNQGTAVIHAEDTLNSLRQYLTVSALYDDSTSAVITNYTLSGALAVGTSTITAAYSGFTDTFDVTVSSHVLYEISAPVVCDGTQTNIDTGVQLLDTDKSFTILVDFTENIDFTVSAKVACTIVYLGRTGVNDYKSTNAANVTQETKLSGGKYTIFRPKESAGSRRIIVAYSHTAGVAGYNVAVSYNGTIQAPDSDTRSNYEYTEDLRTVMIGNTESGSEPFKGTINDFKIYDYAFTQADLEAYATRNA